MSMNKVEVSDLRSLIERSMNCALALAVAEAAKKEADRQLEVFLLAQQSKYAAPGTQQ